MSTSHTIVGRPDRLELLWLEVGLVARACIWREERMSVPRRNPVAWSTGAHLTRSYIFIHAELIHRWKESPSAACQRLLLISRAIRMSSRLGLLCECCGGSFCCRKVVDNVWDFWHEVLHWDPLSHLLLVGLQLDIGIQIFRLSCLLSSLMPLHYLLAFDLWDRDIADALIDCWKILNRFYFRWLFSGGSIATISTIYFSNFFIFHKMAQDGVIFPILEFLMLGHNVNLNLLWLLTFNINLRTVFTLALRLYRLRIFAFLCLWNIINALIIITGS